LQDQRVRFELWPSWVSDDDLAYGAETLNLPRGPLTNLRLEAGGLR
jgi:hypothetical protein